MSSQEPDFSSMVGSYPGRGRQADFDRKRATVAQYPNTLDRAGIKTITRDCVFGNPSIDNNNIRKDDSYAINPRKIKPVQKIFELDWIGFDCQPKELAQVSCKGYAKQASVDGRRRLFDFVGSKLLSLKMDTMKSGISFEKSNQGVLRDEFTTLELDSELINQRSENLDENLDGQLSDGPPKLRHQLSEDYNQLDEPIMDTLIRDLTGIYQKMKIMALPLSSYDIYKVVLRGWDLWGPLMLCTFLAFSLHQSSVKVDNAGPQFADVFVLIWFGSCIISLNYRLLSISSISHERTSQSQTLQSGPHHQLMQTNYENPPNVVDREHSQDNKATRIIISHQETSTFNPLLSPPSTLQLMCVFGYCLVSPCLGLIILKIFSFDRLFFERIILGLLLGFAWPTFCSVRILFRYQHPEKRTLAIYPIGLFYFALSCMIILNH